MDGTRMPGDPAVERMRALVRSVEAPPALRARITARRARRRALGAGAAAAAVLTALAVAVAVVLLPQGTSPTALDAAALAARGPTAPPPPIDPADPDDLARDVEGVAFPAWSQEAGWRAAGERSDTLEGRRAATVYYDGPAGVRLSYTIVAAPALAWPDGGRRAVRRGVEIRLLRSDRAVVATWRVAGHQCVLSAPAAVSDEAVLALASRAGGPATEGPAPAYGAATAPPG
ncbi:MAG TPA: hypothetical protein VHK00_00460 [Miltoncostaeaceae bacterium]|nr:hypothetical protein [Miltoncostaeaceae bacterium]